MHFIAEEYVLLKIQYYQCVYLVKVYALIVKKLSIWLFYSLLFLDLTATLISKYFQP